MTHLKKFLTSAIFLALTFAVPMRGHAVGYYTPPCFEKLNEKDDALLALHRCLGKKSNPPFKGDEEPGYPPICANEMRSFLEQRSAYKDCLAGLPSLIPPVEKASPLPRQRG